MIVFNLALKALKSRVFMMTLNYHCTVFNFFLLEKHTISSEMKVIVIFRARKKEVD